MCLSDRDLGPIYVWPIGLWSKRLWPIDPGLTDCFFVNFITTFNILHDRNETTKRKERIAKKMKKGVVRTYISFITLDNLLCTIFMKCNSESYWVKLGPHNFFRYIIITGVITSIKFNA